MIEKELLWVHALDEVFSSSGRIGCSHDALKDTMFSLIDEMLLRVYYVYKKSPKKCREINDIITDLQEYIQFMSVGIRFVRSSGS